jgi:hypothetical protein
MLTMIYMARIQNMSVFLLKINNPSVCHPVWPRRAPRPAPVWPRLAPVGHPVRPPSGTPICPSVWPSVRPRPAPSLAGLKGINLLKFA